MARLNEVATVQTETIESLKRKFMRQNRDIARANSAQSLRIRNLENETSRLLAENLGLREQIIQLQNELENGKAQRIADSTGVIKSQLEAKLLEISALITGLGDGSVPKKRSPRESKISRASPTQSPDQRNWKNMCTLSEAVAGQEGRLPPILENKSYPRRTLERQDFVELVADAAVDTIDSPEIGPPPVSQFFDEDPVKIDLPSRPRKNEADEISALDPSLSMSIEQRKKRRDSSVGAESRRPSKIELALERKENTSSLRVGAKRKLSVMDDEEKASVTKPMENSDDEFKYTRIVSEERSKAVPQAERSSSKVARDLAIARGAPRDKLSGSAAPSSRKALAPKSVNNSPKKSSKISTHDEVKAIKGNPMRDQQRDKRQDSISAKSVANDPQVQIVEVQSEPETPMGPDIFSPPSSQPSTARNESRDTPPPSDIRPGVDAQRPSRRARPAVSYAEPNLRDKMRRPTKELVDAVVPGTGTGSLRARIIKSESDSFGASVTIKSEPETTEEWKRMPLMRSATVENSPLSGKVADPALLPTNIITHRKRRESLLAENDIPKINSATAVAALLAGNRRTKAEEQENPFSQGNTASKASKFHDIYDFRGSSPAPADEDCEKVAREEKLVSRISRRRSSLARDVPSVYDSESSDPEGFMKADTSKSRRRQSTLGLRTSSAGSEHSKGEETEKTLRRASSTTKMPDSAALVERTDRTSARRRSMML